MSWDVVMTAGPPAVIMDVCPGDRDRHTSR
jgi:hypothetical protein